MRFFTPSQPWPLGRMYTSKMRWRGKENASLQYLRARVAAWEEDCEHCGHRMRPLSLRFDFDELTVAFECSLCGKLNRRPGAFHFPDRRVTQ